MINASVPPQEGAALIRRLETQAARLGEKRAAQLAAALRRDGHRWRSPETLWPDLGWDGR